MKLSTNPQPIEGKLVRDGNRRPLAVATEKGRYPWPLSEDAVCLAAALKASCAEMDQIVLFTGIAEREGVSTVAAQVALALAQMGPDPVLLLDANLRTPSVHTVFQVQPTPGLSDAIEQRATSAEVIRPSQHSRLSLLPSGPTSENALALFSMPACSTLMRDLRKEFRFVIVDSFPLLQSADTTLLVSHADSIVLTVAAGVHHLPEIVEVKRHLDRLNAAGVRIVLCEKQLLASLRSEYGVARWDLCRYGV